MSFQFSPETFIREIDFQIEEFQAEINNLTIPLNQLLDVGPPPLVPTEFEPAGFARFGVPSIPGVKNQREVDASRAAIRGHNNSVSDLTNRIRALETQISSLLTQRRAFQTEIEVRMTIPTDVSLDGLAPPIDLGASAKKIDPKQLAILIGLGLLVL